MTSATERRGSTFTTEPQLRLPHRPGGPSNGVPGRSSPVSAGEWGHRVFQQGVDRPHLHPATGGAKLPAGLTGNILQRPVGRQSWRRIGPLWLVVMLHSRRHAHRRSAPRPRIGRPPVRYWKSVLGLGTHLLVRPARERLEPVRHPSEYLTKTLKWHPSAHCSPKSQQTACLSGIGHEVEENGVAGVGKEPPRQFFQAAGSGPGSRRWRFLVEPQWPRPQPAADRRST